MPTDKVLKTINVFPDQETFEQNEASLQDGELSLVPVRVVKTINGAQPDAAGNVDFDTGLGKPNIGKIMNIPSNPWVLTSNGECHMKRGSGGGGSITVNDKGPGIYPEDYSELSVVLVKGDKIGWGGLEYAKFIPWE